jgi:serine/threonine protein kinase
LINLHECGIVHGDVKCENVLVFQEGDSVIAKISDFGNSVIISEVSNFCQLPGGTPPWNAPEWQDSLKKEYLYLTDVYSYGLLVWRVILNDKEVLEERPFLFTHESCLLDTSEPYIIVNDLEEFKRSNELLQLVLDKCEMEPEAIDFAKDFQAESGGLVELFGCTLSTVPADRNLRKASEVFGAYTKKYLTLVVVI